MKRRFILALLAAVVMSVGQGQGAGPAPGGREEALVTLDFRAVVRAAKNKVFPAVVFIKCMQENLESGKKITSEVSGSGVIISAKGEVLTNWHVVEKAVEVRCLLYDGRHLAAKVVGSDKDTDLALVQLTLAADEKPLPFAALGDSKGLKEGDFVMAMGAPWGLNRSVSMGIVACTNRYLETKSEYSLWLQTDASISPGNSGGPLVNTAGEVIGVTTLGSMQGGDLGFAVPSETIQTIVAQIRESGRVNWSWTGLQLQPLKDFNKNMYFEANEGVIVAETDPESPARRAGVQPRDRILTVNGRAVTGLHDEDLPAIRREFGLLPKNKPAKLSLVRGAETVTVEVTPREKGKVEGAELDCPRWDLTVKQINQFDNPDLFFYQKEGVFVYGTKYPGNAATAGLRDKDIILQIGGKDVKTLDDAKAIHKAAIENIEKEHRIVFTVLRGGLRRQVVLDFQRDYEKE